MVLHSTLSGADNHDPRGVTPDYLVLTDNVNGVYRIEDDNGDAYLYIDTTNSAEQIVLGNTTTNPDLVLAGSGEVKMDYLVLRETTKPSTSALVQVGKLYSKDVSGQSELHYVDEDGNETQITSAGSLAGSGGGTLDTAYDYGGAHLGRQINVDSGFPVQLTAGAGTDEALEITGVLAFASSTIIIGGGSHGTPSGIVIGDSAQGAGGSVVVVGQQANAAGSGAIAIGRTASAGFANSIALGYGATVTAANQMMVGNSTRYITACVIGGGDTDSNARTLSLRPSNATGTDVAGWDLQVQAGLGTGSGAGGKVALQTSAPAGTGSSLNTAFDAVFVDPDTGGATSVGEGGLAANEDTEPKRFTHTLVDTGTATSGTLFTIDFSQYANNTTQMGWLKVKVVAANSDTGTDFEANELFVSFYLDGSGNVGSFSTDTVAAPAAIGSGITGYSIGANASGSTLKIDFAQSGSDNVTHMLWAEWSFSGF